MAEHDDNPGKEGGEGEAPRTGPRVGKDGGRQGRIKRSEMESRIDYTCFLLSRRVFKSDIKRILKSKYKISFRTCESYISRARDLLVERAGLSRDEHRVLSLAFYESVIRNDDASETEKMRAQERIDWLLGLGPRDEEKGDKSAGAQVHVYIPDNGRDARPAGDEPQEVPVGD